VTPELFGPFVLARIGDAEEAPLVADPDPDLAAIGALERHIPWLSVRDSRPYLITR